MTSKGKGEKEGDVANYYIADLHLGHENVIRFDNRPFADLEEMHRTIIDNWNRTVTAGDTVYILGDMIWGKEAEWPSWLSRFSGNKVLITGNHDPKRLSEKTRRFFQDVEDYKEIADDGRRVILCHYAMPFHRAAYGECCYMLYGHVHNTREYAFLERLRRDIRDSCTQKGFARGNFINVGCMMPWIDYTPRTLEEIIRREAEYRKLQIRTEDGSLSTRG